MYLSSVYQSFCFLPPFFLPPSLPPFLSPSLSLSSFLSSISPVYLSMCLSSVYQLSNLFLYLLCTSEISSVCLLSIEEHIHSASHCWACTWGVYSASLPRDSQSPAPITNLLTLVAFIFCISFLLTCLCSFYLLTNHFHSNPWLRIFCENLK